MGNGVKKHIPFHIGLNFGGEISVPNKNKLSIYMIKEEYEADDIIENYNTAYPIEGVGTAYLGFSRTTIPKWVNSFFVGEISSADVFTANARAVLLLRVNIDENNNQRTFALTMGYGKHMLKDDVVEERFGLKVILNTISPNSLRRINKINIGGNQKLSNEQLPLKAGIRDFGLDINRDLVSHIAGVSDDDEYVTGILSGGDILSVTAEVDISNIVSFLQMTYQRYCLNNYTVNFGWVDQIQEVKDTHLIANLDSEMIAAINMGSTDIWMAVPEIIDWTEIRGFKYRGREIYDDIDISIVRDSFREGLQKIGQLKGKRISAISSRDDSERYSWGAHRCLFGELFFDNNAYCINNGKWYRIDNDFVEQVNRDYNNTSIANIDFDDFTNDHSSENAYNSYLKDNHPEDYLLMDANNFSYGGGHSKIELCDLLSKNKELIHVKHYSGSATLSHLFNQAAVSAELVLSDAQFLALANEKITELTDSDEFQINDRRAIRVVFGIISKNHSPLPHLPFFSKISFRHTKNRLEAFGLDVSIRTIRNVRTR